MFINGVKTFTDIRAPNAISDSQAINKKQLDEKLAKIPQVDSSQYILKTGDIMTGQLIVPKYNYPIQGDLNKVINYESMREIFLSKKEGGQMEQVFDLNNHHIENLRIPTASDHRVNKGYVDDQISKLKIPPAIDETQFLKLDGSQLMSGDLDMGQNKIKNVGTPQTHENDRAVNVGFFNQELNSSNANLVKTLTDQYKEYVEHSHISPTASKKDVFRYIMQDVNESSSEVGIIVHGIVDHQSSFQSINKKAYRVSLTIDSSTDYRSRIGFNLYQLPLGYYSFILEFMPMELSSVSVTAVGITIYIAKQSTKQFDKYTKTLVQFHQNSKQGPDFIYFDLHGKITHGNNIAYIIVYGTEGYHSSVDPAVYDNWYTINNGELVMNTNIDMGGNSINNLKAAKDAITKEYTEANYISKNGDEMKSELSMGAKRITNLAPPRFDFDAANAKYIEDNYVKLTGPTNDFSMNNHKITNIALPISNGDGISLQYLKNTLETIQIYGQTDSNSGVFQSINGIVLIFANINLHWIRLHGDSQQGKSDSIIISHSGSPFGEYYNFIHSSHSYRTSIYINRKFSSLISIKLKSKAKISFTLGYKSLFI